MLSKLRFLLLFMSFFLGSFAHSLTFQPPIKNLDKRKSYLTPSFEDPKSSFNLFMELNYIQDPLIAAGSFSGNTEPLLKGLMGTEIGLNYWITPYLSTGILLPMIKTMGSDEEFRMLGALIEFRLRMGNLMFIPSYQMPSEYVISIPSPNGPLDIPFGHPSGVFGGKLIYNLEKILGISTHIFGAIYQSQENSYLNIDESFYSLSGISLGLDLDDEISLGGDLVGGKTKENNLLDGFLYLTFKQSQYFIQTGLGNDLIGSGSSPLKIFFNLTYNFGQNKKQNSSNFPMYIPPSKKDSREIKIKDSNKTKTYEGEMWGTENENQGPLILAPENRPTIQEKETITPEEKSIYFQEEQ